MTPSQLAVYQGADREKILVEGAKREGEFTLYTSHTWFRTFVKEFEKKYPFVRASEWRNDSKNVIRKVLEEVKAGRVLADVVETTADGMGVMKREGLFQEYFSPEARNYPSELKPRGKNGFFYLPNRETYNSLGFNNKLIPSPTAPRGLKDLLDPKWKGKMAITSTTTGARWIGIGSAGLLAKAANPNTALLFIDFLLSKEGQQLIMKGGLWSPREDMGSLDQKFKKNYMDEKYSSEEMEAKLGQWETLLRQLFIRKR